MAIFRRIGMSVTVGALLIAFSGCGSEPPAVAESAQAPTAPAAPTAPSAPTAVPQVDEPDSSVAIADAPAPVSDGCEAVLTVGEIDAIFGTAIQRFAGAGKFCNIAFADDSVGSFSVLPASDAEEAMLAFSAERDEAVARGVQLGGDRGYILDRSVVVIGDSGRLFRFDLPGNVGPDDVSAHLAQMADLLLAR